MNKSKLRTFISGILAFIMTMLIFGFVLLITAELTIFDVNFVKNSLGKSNFYERTRVEILSNYENIEESGGIPVRVYEEVLQSFQNHYIYNDINNQLEAYYSGDTYKIDISKLEGELKTAIKEYAASINQEISDEGLTTIIEYCSENYKLIVNNKFITILGQAKTIFDKILLPAVIFIMVCMFFVLLMIFKMRKHKHRAVRHLSYGIGAAFIMTMIIPIYLLYDKFYMRLNITPAYVKFFIINMIEGFNNMMLYSGVILGTLTVGLIIIVHFMKKKV